MTAVQREEFAKRTQDLANKFAFVIDDLERLERDLGKACSNEHVEAVLGKDRRRHKETHEIMCMVIDRLWEARRLMLSIRVTGEPPRLR